MKEEISLKRLGAAFDLLVLGGACDSGEDFYKMAALIDRSISPATVNEEIWSAVNRWEEAASIVGPKERTWGPRG